MHSPHQKLLQDIRNIDGVASVRLHEREPLIFIQLRRDSQTTIDRVRELLREPLSGLHPRFEFPKNDEVAQMPSGDSIALKKTAEISTDLTVPEVPVVDPDAETAVWHPSPEASSSQ